MIRQLGASVGVAMYQHAKKKVINDGHKKARNTEVLAQNYALQQLEW
jgi:hypothetical protein